MHGLRRIFAALAAAGLAAGLGAADLGVPLLPDDPDLKKLQDLDRRSGNAPRLPQSGATLGEAALSASELANAALQGEAGGAWKQEDYDALYALLQRYRDALRKMGLDQKELEDQLAGLKVRAASLEERLAKLHPRDGMKVHGSSRTYYDDMLIAGPGMNSGRTTRYRHGLMRTLMDFEFTRGPVSGHLGLNFIGLFNLYATTFALNMDQLAVELRLPVSLEAGLLDFKMTPLTYWRNEDPDPYEPALFRVRREDMADDLHLKPNAWHQFGARVGTDVRLFGGQELELELFGFQVPQLGGSIYTHSTNEPPQGDPLAGQAQTQVYTTYLGAWRAGLPLPAGLHFSYQGTIYRDAPDTAYKTYAAGHPLAGQQIRAFDSQVHSARLEFKKGPLDLGGEWAQSLFSSPSMHSKGASDYLTGTALVASLGLRLDSLGLTLSGRSVSRYFVSAPAQGRSEAWDQYPLSPFATETTAYWIGPWGIPMPPESQFLRGFVHPQTADAGGATFHPVGSHLLPFDPRRNLSRPYGEATPNRAGFGVAGDVGFFKRFIVLDGGWDSAAETEVPTGASPFVFTDTRAGLRFDFSPLLDWPIAFGGGYALRDMCNSRLAFSAAQVDLDLVWRVGEKTRLLLAGRHIDANGSLPYNGTDIALKAFGNSIFQQTNEMAGGGLIFDLDDSIQIRLSYTSGTLTDYLKASRNLQFEQSFARMSVLF